MDVGQEEESPTSSCFSVAQVQAVRGATCTLLSASGYPHSFLFPVESRPAGVHLSIMAGLVGHAFGVQHEEGTKIRIACVRSAFLCAFGHDETGSATTSSTCTASTCSRSPPSRRTSCTATSWSRSGPSSRPPSMVGTQVHVRRTQTHPYAGWVGVSCPSFFLLRADS